MRRRSLLSRILLAAVAIVQMAAPPLAVVADARLIAGAGGAPQVHVEDHTQNGCRPVHPDDCALCQLLTHFSGAARLAAPQAAGRDRGALRVPRRCIAWPRVQSPVRSRARVPLPSA